MVFESGVPLTMVPLEVSGRGGSYARVQRNWWGEVRWRWTDRIGGRVTGLPGEFGACQWLAVRQWAGRVMVGWLDGA